MKKKTGAKTRKALVAAGPALRKKLSAKAKTKAVHVKAPVEPAAVGLSKEGGGGFKKLYLKNRPVCKVTFRLPGEAVPEARAVSLVGDFNNWDAGALPMRRLKNGSFTATLSLEAGKDYCFRYLIDGQKWENDWRADRYIKNSFGTDDSVVAV